MRKLSLVILSFIMSFSIVGVVSAEGATINRGACMSQVEVSLKRYQAPGKNGNGPLTVIVNKNGYKVNTASFDGGMGCTR